MRNLFFVFLIFFLPSIICAEILQHVPRQTAPDSSSKSNGKESYYNQGLNRYQSGKFSEAIFYFDTCLIIDSSFKEARFLKALSLEKKGDLIEAITEFEIIKRDDPLYDDIDKRIKNYHLTVYLSKNWYYMLAMLFLVILFMAVVVKTIAYKKLQ